MLKGVLKTVTAMYTIVHLVMVIKHPRKMQIKQGQLLSIKERSFKIIKSY